MFCLKKSTQKKASPKRLRLLSLWYKTKLSLWLFPLIPFSVIMKSIVKLRFYAYSSGKIKSVKTDVPVIIAGNITVGGSGKTPLVHALVKHLVSKGLKPGIISRGYGATLQVFPTQVFADSDPAIYGDEPVMLAQLTQRPMVIDPNRPRGAQMLSKQLGCDVIISDDGLQHYRLARDIEIVVLDGQKGWGNGYCLPAGPLREPLERLNKADLLVSKGEVHFNFKRPLDVMKITGTTVKNLFSDDSLTLKEFTGQYHQVHGVAGIGHPGSFFETLRQAGMHVIEHCFSDHHHYHAADLIFSDNYPIIMTEKDAVKCKKFAHKNMWYFPVKGLLEETFWKKFDAIFYPYFDKSGKRR